MMTMTIDSDVRDHGAWSAQRDAASLIYRAEGELRSASPVGLCSEGLRFVNALEADVVAGPFAGGHLSGLDQFTLRADGIGHILAPETIEAGAAPVTVQVRGQLLPPEPLDLRLPESGRTRPYDLPDVDFRLTGYALVRTDDPGHAHLDRTVASILGWVNFESGELAVEAYAM